MSTLHECSCSDQPNGSPSTAPGSCGYCLGGINMNNSDLEAKLEELDLICYEYVRYALNYVTAGELESARNRLATAVLLMKALRLIRGQEEWLDS